MPITVTKINDIIYYVGKDAMVTIVNQKWNKKVEALSDFHA